MDNKIYNNHKKNQYSALRNTYFYFKEIFTRQPRTIICLLVAISSGISLPFLNAKLPQLVLRGLEESWALPLFLQRILLLSILLALIGIIRSGTDSYLDPMSIPFQGIYSRRVFQKRLVVDYEILENKQFHDEAHTAYNSIYRPHSEIRHGLGIWKDFLVAILSAILYSAILLTQSAIILILVLFPTILTAFLQKKARAYDQKMRILAEASNRKMDYIARQTSDFHTGKDIRIFHLSNWLLGILKKERRISESYVKKWENAYLGANCVDSLLNFLRDSCAYLFLIFQIVQGKMAVSDFVWYMAVVANCQQACSRLLSQGEQLGRLNMDYGRIRHFLNEWNETTFSGKWKEKCPHPVEIEFRHVTFTYPESSRPTLTDLNFTIRPSEKIALVGLNGAGKTTLVKLLCGLYHPTDGQILVNGKNVKDYDRETYYKMISAVFQDVRLLPLSIAQNVASVPEKEIDIARVKECLKLAGLWEKVARLPEKENTSLGKQVSENAIDLSGGERQKLWMARAFYKEAPVLILDEPTAALDPLAEQEVYEKYRKMAAGKTSLFISHRLSSTSFCDRVFFLEKGRITEEGNHKALLAQNGAYANLFEIQSQYYRKETATL